MTAYYNEIDPYAAQWLRNLIAAGHIAPGDVDERSIIDVRPDELAGYTQCHFFAGIGGWSLALRLAGWDDDRPVWTGSCPCQPFSAAGKGEAANDERHLWPAWLPLITERRPPIVFGEQVEAVVGWGWVDAVFSDLEAEGYACGTAVLPACGVGAPHIRQRLWFVADLQIERWDARRTSEAAWNTSVKPDGHCDDRIELANSFGEGLEVKRLQPARDQCAPIERGGATGELGNATGRQQRWPREPEPIERWSSAARGSSAWGDLEWLPCTDGKARPVEPGTFPLAHGVSGRVGRLRAYGNAIVPQVAAEFIKAFCAN